MFDIGWSEMLVIGVVALIVVGPKDLPKMFHTLGQVTAKARGMAREFQRAMDSAAKDSGVGDIARDIRRTASGQSIKEAVGLDDIEKQFRDIGHDRPVVRPVIKPMPSAGTPAVDPAIDAEEAARNEAFSATEELRLKRASEAAESRRRAAEMRARRQAEAEASAAEQRAEPEPQAWQPPAARHADPES